MLCNVWGQIGTEPVRYLTESWENLVDIFKFPDEPLLDYFLTIPLNDWPEQMQDYRPAPFNLRLGVNIYRTNQIEERHPLQWQTN